RQAIKRAHRAGTGAGREPLTWSWEDIRASGLEPANSPVPGRTLVSRILKRLPNQPGVATMPALSVLLEIATLLCSEPIAADLVLHHGKIWTVNRAQPEVEAVAVWRDRIVKVGTDADIRPLIGPKTRVVDLRGRRVAPGFHDSHVHFLGSGQQLGQVDLKN